MKPSLQLRQSQQLTLTPQLQQSIKLLQMSTLELSQEVEQALAENPMLERADNPLDDAVRIAPDGVLQSGTTPQQPDVNGPGDTSASSSTTDSAPDNTAASESSTPDNTVAEPYSQWEGSGAGPGPARDNPDDDAGYAQIGSSEPSLREHLVSQVSGTSMPETDRILFELLVDELSDDGYLGCSVTEFLELLPGELELEEADVSAVLTLLQSFDPPGVGARDLRECLMIQLDLLRDEQAHDEQAQADPAIDLAHRIADRHLELLAQRDFSGLRRALKCSEGALKEAQEIILSLNPRPGANFAADEPTYVVPDVIVKRDGEDWQVTLNPSVMPKLRVNDMYADVLRQHKGISSNLSGQLQEARWLIKNIQQRFETILRVSNAIVERQRAFFSHGEVGMRPLVLREIADTLGLHESTVSRVTTHKYMLTPHGTFELKYFFGSHVATDSGGAASSTAIRALIKQVISAEDSKKPLSDNRIAQLLAEQGFVVARRTVAKYRETLKIPPVSLRKTL
jgi:RNA polymerase sigma-54 factor